MGPIHLLVKKELRSYFTSPLIYILTAFFVASSGWFFFNYIVMSKNLTNLNLSSSVLMPTFGNINFLLLMISPLITMKMFAEEKRENTLDLLFLSNLNHFDIILGKFISSLMLILFMLLFTLIYPLILSFSGYSDWGTVAMGYLGLIFSVSSYLMVGLFASSLTENQILSAVISFAILIFFMFFILASNATNNVLVGQIVRYISLTYHYEPFARGILRSYNLFYYLSFIFFFYFLTNRSLDSRKW